MLKVFISITLFLLNCAIGHVYAAPAVETVNSLNNSVLRVHVNLPNGKHGLGSAVVIAQNQVVTSCHVVNEATDVYVIAGDVKYLAKSIKPDWRHDVCILIVENLHIPNVRLGDSDNLKYQDSIFTVGYPGEVKTPINTYGVVKGLFPMDGGVVIRATSAFKLGSSGGGAFDDAGNLMGIITVKSQGEEPYYYFVPVKWVKNLMVELPQALGFKGEKPFWAEAPKQRPYFMQVAYPYVKQDWPHLLEVAKEWVIAQPNVAESWFYLAVAEYAVKDFSKAEEHFKNALFIDENHTDAASYLKKLTDQALAEDRYASNIALLN